MRTLSLSLLLLALGGVAHAATPSHRLVAVGQALNWPSGDQSLTLNVREPGVVTLTVDRPGFDGSGYTARRTATGDEQYRPGVVTTTYQLSDAAGRVLLRRDSAPGQVAPQTLFSGALQPGAYRLTMSVTGAAKRAVGLSVTGPVEVSATTINNTVRGRQWTPVNTVRLGGQATLRLYNGDSARELELRLRYENGKIMLLPSGARGRWTQIPLAAGTGVIEARQGPGAKQWSKSFALSLTDGQAQAVPQVLQAWTVAVAEQVAQVTLARTQVVEVQDVRASAREVLVRDVTPVNLPAQAASGSPFIGPVQVGTLPPAAVQGTAVTTGVPVSPAAVDGPLQKTFTLNLTAQGAPRFRYNLWPTEISGLRLP
ncbi:hypothetical protein DEIPH_ctg139orf0136 [Deinococcus phoenicis]|uniref:Uncharacterized protein n=1 Tax=Deinococcus phoenicis TaxID=1476583 RepID=A0A016QK16_9DEIO|nr:hypothetical protein [Deinococcus phoenicis]EYB66408.1 hypothetical protein DEIPH_ctg139orf0136 [Deinococcus phoenicis]